MDSTHTTFASARADNVVRWLRAEARHARGGMLLAAALGALSGFLLVPQAWCIARAVSRVVLVQADLAEVLPWLWPLPVIFALRFTLARASEQSAMRAATQVKERVRMQLVRRLQALGPAYVRTRHSGEIVAAAVDGVEALEPYYARYLPHLALVAVVPLAILAFVYARDWISGLVLLCAVPLIPLFMVLIGGAAENLSRRQWRRLARLSAYFLDTLQGLVTLKLFNAARREAALVARLSDDYRRSTMSVLRVAFLSALALEFFSIAGIALVAVLIGFRLLYGQIGFETGFFVLLLAPEFFLPWRALGAHYHARMEAIGAAERIVEVFDHPLREPAHARARPPLDRPLEIRFENVHYAYAAARAALRGASFDLASGRVTAMVGPSGAGKSTVANVLLGFVRAQSGCVLASGHDLSLIDPDYWLTHVAWVPQRPHLFRGSILDNIRMHDETISLDRVRVAARCAHADEFIERLPAGYHTLLGERGANLAGGQVQRLALARAFLKDAPLLLMDEATAALDAPTETLVTDAIARLARGRTVLVIAHRLRTVRHADGILVMDCGQIVEHGNHDALLHAGGRYARMVRTDLNHPVTFGAGRGPLIDSTSENSEDSST